MTGTDNAILRLLSNSSRVIDGSANDVRGREVKDKYGADAGKVVDLLIDDREHKVRFLLVEHGGFLGMGSGKSFIPVETIIQITKNDIHIDRSRSHVAAAPGYDPELINNRTHHDSIYNHYGYKSCWEAGYISPPFPYFR